MPTPRFVAWLVLLPLLVAFASPAVADEQSDTTESAILLMRRSMQISRNGQHNVLLSALRQLRDPELTPFFSDLAQSDAAQLKLHGLLGLAECSPDHKLDLVRVAAMGNKSAQAQLIGTAMDAHLVSDEQARQIINWGEIDPAVKLVVAVPLIKDNALKQIQPDLRSLYDNLKQETARPEATKPAAGKTATRANDGDDNPEGPNKENLARRGVAALMLYQLGEPGMEQELEAINKSADARRDEAREYMLRTAYVYEFDKAGGWAMGIVNEPDVSPRLAIAALRTALRLGAPGATDAFQKQFKSAVDAASRMKLALEALKLSPWMAPEFYEALIHSDDAQIKQMGLTGAAIAGKKDVASSVVALVEMGHPIAVNWVIGFARKHATKEDAQRILMAVVAAAENGQDRTRAQRLYDAAMAVEMLMEVDPQVGPELVRPILARPETEAPVAQAILLGLINSDTPAPQAAQGLTFKDPFTSNLAIVLLAKSGQGLSPEQLRDLSVVVRGGGVKQESVRVQAAWTYLKLTGQTRDALAQVLGRTGLAEPLPVQNAKP